MLRLYYLAALDSKANYEICEFCNCVYDTNRSTEHYQSATHVQGICNKVLVFESDGAENGAEVEKLFCLGCTTQQGYLCDRQERAAVPHEEKRKQKRTASGDLKKHQGKSVAKGEDDGKGMRYDICNKCGKLRTFIFENDAQITVADGVDGMIKYARVLKDILGDWPIALEFAECELANGESKAWPGVWYAVHESGQIKLCSQQPSETPYRVVVVARPCRWRELTHGSSDERGLGEQFTGAAMHGMVDLFVLISREVLELCDRDADAMKRKLEEGELCLRAKPDGPRGWLWLEKRVATTLASEKYDSDDDVDDKHAEAGEARKEAAIDVVIDCSSAARNCDLFSARPLSEELDKDGNLQSIMLSRGVSEPLPASAVKGKFAAYPPSVDLKKLPEEEAWVFLVQWHSDKMVNKGDAPIDNQFSVGMNKFVHRNTEAIGVLTDRVDALSERVDGVDSRLDHVAARQVVHSAQMSVVRDQVRGVESHLNVHSARLGALELQMLRSHSSRRAHIEKV